MIRFEIVCLSSCHDGFGEPAQLRGDATEIEVCPRQRGINARSLSQLHRR